MEPEALKCMDIGSIIGTTDREVTHINSAVTGVVFLNISDVQHMNWPHDKPMPNISEALLKTNLAKGIREIQQGEVVLLDVEGYQISAVCQFENPPRITTFSATWKPEHIN